LVLPSDEGRWLLRHSLANSPLTAFFTRIKIGRGALALASARQIPF
jgi:hypothetical protein